MMVGVEVRDLSKSYPLTVWGALESLALALITRRPSGRLLKAGLTALDRVDLTFRAGERVGIIGANGAGKSTLLKLIAGVIEPSRGTVTVHGRLHSILTLGVGLDERANGYENIRIALDLEGVEADRIHALSGEVADFSGLAGSLERPVRTYSSGMKSRLAFAIATAHEPEILLVDETLSVGDVQFASKAAQRMRRLCDRGALVLLVSHNLDSIEGMTRRCLWMDEGRVRMDGPSGEVVAAYRAELQAQGRRRQALAGGEAAETGETGERGLRILLPAGAGGEETVLPVGAAVVSGQELILHWRPRLMNPLPAGEALVVVLTVHTESGRLLARVEGAVDPAGGWRTTLGPVWWGEGGYVLRTELYAAGGRRLEQGEVCVWVRVPQASVGGEPLLVQAARVTGTWVGE